MVRRSSHCSLCSVFMPFGAEPKFPFKCQQTFLFCGSSSYPQSAPESLDRLLTNIAGTLTPIVKNPDRAFMSDQVMHGEMRPCRQKLTNICLSSRAWP